MSFILATRKQNISIPLTKAHLLWTHEAFDPKQDVVIFVTGWLSDYTNSNNTNVALETMRDAYLCRGNVNFIVRFCSEFSPKRNAGFLMQLIF